MSDSFELTVLDVVEETGDARSVVLDPGEHREHFQYKPGQFLTVAVPSDRTGLVARSYSLSSTPVDEDGPLTITVKRTPDGYASEWICKELHAGDSLRVLPPAGIFTPKDLDADLLLFAGGSGITPIMSIIRTALARGSGRIVLFYGNRDERSVIFAARALRARGGASRSPPGGALARVGAGPAHAGTAPQLRGAVHRVGSLRVRADAVHEGGHGGPEGARVPARAPAPGEVRLAGRQPVRGRR